MQGPSEEGASPKSAEDPEESTGGEAGSELGDQGSLKARRTEEKGVPAEANEAPSDGPSEESAAEGTHVDLPPEPLWGEADAEPPQLEEPDLPPLVDGEVQDLGDRGLNRIEVEHPEFDLPEPKTDSADRGMNRVEVDHPDPLPPESSNAPARGIKRVELDHPDPLIEPESREPQERGINRVQLDHAVDVLPAEHKPATEPRGLNRVELMEPPLRLPEAWAGPKDKAKRVEIPHELDSILGIKTADPDVTNETGPGTKDALSFVAPQPAPAPEKTPEPREAREAHSAAPTPPREPATSPRQSESVSRPPVPAPHPPQSEAPRPAREVAHHPPSGPSAKKQPEAPGPRVSQHPTSSPVVKEPALADRLPKAAEPRSASAATATVRPETARPALDKTSLQEARPATPAAVHLNGEGAVATTDSKAVPEEKTPAAAAAPTEPKERGNWRKSKWLAWFLGKPALVEGIVTPVPPLGADRNEVKLREYEPGTSYSRVFFDTKRARHGYALIEPPLDEREKRSLQFVKEVLLRTLDIELEMVERGVAQESLSLLDDRVKKVVRDYRMDLSQTSLKRIIYYLRRDFTGYGPIDVMMHDPDIEDISCDGPGTNVFLYHRRFGSMESNVFFRDSEELDGFVIRMAQRSGKQITIADPLLDSSLPDGSRLQATLGREVTDNGSTFTIRRFRENPLSPIDLVRMGTMSAELLAYCWIVVQYGANVMLAGGTASGKTTTLNTISLFIPPQAKIVSIEDTREINLPHKNWVRSVTRGGTRGNDLKRVDMFDLLTAALRQRPEYILVGEVRGKEATVAFQAMATGHTVLGTIHADSPRSVVYRLESEPINIPRIVIQSLDVIILQALLNVNGRRQRRVQDVAEIVGIDPASKELLTHGVFQRNATTDQLHYTGRSYKLQKIAQRNNWSAKDLEREQKRRAQIINTLVAMPGVRFEDIGQLFSTYENQPEVVDSELERLRRKAAQTEGTN